MVGMYCEKKSACVSMHVKFILPLIKNEKTPQYSDFHYQGVILG